MKLDKKFIPNLKSENMNSCLFICAMLLGICLTHSLSVEAAGFWSWNPRVNGLGVQVDQELFVECLKFGELIKEWKAKNNGNIVKNLINSKVLNVYIYRKNLNKCAPLIEKQKLNEEKKKEEDLKKSREERESQIFRSHLANRIKSTILKDFITMRY
jgi:hypothetical protein